MDDLSQDELALLTEEERDLFNEAKTDIYFAPPAIEEILTSLIAARAKLGECDAGYQTMERELAQARQEIERKNAALTMVVKKRWSMEVLKACQAALTKEPGADGPTHGKGADQ